MAPIQADLCVTVTIDHELDLVVKVVVKWGSTVRELKEKLAAEDLTGELLTDHIQICIPSWHNSQTAQLLDNDHPLDDGCSVVELCQASSMLDVTSIGANTREETIMDSEKYCQSDYIELLDSGVPTVGESVRRGAIYATSDTHCETKHNMMWLENLPSHPEDTIIVAGDLAVDIAQIEQALRLFTSKFKHVFYCFGNHECWVSKTCGYKDSFGKIDAIRELCEVLNVKTKTTLVDEVWIVPICGWYHNSWDTEPPLTPPHGMKLKREPRNAATMSNDTIYCNWGDIDNGTEELAERLDKENIKWGSWPLPSKLLEDAQSPPGKRQRPIISFSHFLPRQELHPEKRFLMEPNLSKLIGCNWIRARVEELRPDIHVFGHTHMCWDMRLDDVRYLSWPLGMPPERYHKQMMFPQSPSEEPLKVLDSEGHQAPEDQGVCFASRMYKFLNRDPSSCVMSHRVANKYCPDAPVLFDDIVMSGRAHIFAMPGEEHLRQRILAAEKGLEGLRRKERPRLQEWEVVGGEGRGGILVRMGKDLASEKYPERLSFGALVEELTLMEDRLLYRLVSGTGPEQGWVSTELPDKPLVVQTKMPPEKGKLSLKRTIELLEQMIDRLSNPSFQLKMTSLIQQYPGSKRWQLPFASQRWELLRAELEKVLPKFGFPDGNFIPLDTVISPFVKVDGGDVKVMRLRCKLQELIYANKGEDIYSSTIYGT